MLLSSDNTGKGLAVLQAAEKSELSWVRVENLSSPSHKGWSTFGGITFFESPLKIESVIISNSRGANAISIARTDVEIKGLTISDTKRNGFRGDFIKGAISELKIVDIGINGIHLHNCEVQITDVSIRNIGEKGLYVLRESIVVIDALKIEKSDVSIYANNGSLVKVIKATIENARIGIGALRTHSQFKETRIELGDIEFKSVETNSVNDSNSEIIRNNKINQPSLNASKLIGLKK